MPPFDHSQLPTAMKLIIFDVDGTLVDSQATILIGLQAGFEAVGMAMPDRKTALSIVGLSLDRAFAELAGPENAHLVPLMSDGYRKKIFARRDQGLDIDPLYPGAREAVERLNARDDVLLGIATGKARRGVKHMCDCHDLHGRFTTIQTADTSPSKPHPDMIEQALSETGADPSQTVMIGDTAFDMEMAGAAGVAAVGVSWGYHDTDRLLGAGASKIIHNYNELDPVLDALLSAGERQDHA